MTDIAAPDRTKELLAELDDDVREEVEYLHEQAVAEAGRTPATFGDRERWQQLVHEGGKRFGWGWIHAQEEARALLGSFGFEPDEYRALVAAIAFRIALHAFAREVPFRHSASEIRADEQGELSPREQGSLAFLGGLGREGCPFPMRSTERAEWFTGYKDAETEAAEPEEARHHA